MWPFGSAYPEAKPQEIHNKEFDYVIVGGGTAGCVLAARLSEDQGVSVLVIERGAVGDHWLSRVPLISGSLARFFQVTHRWSEPIEHCNGRRTDLWTGEALGGSSRINQMLYTRGIPGIYNEWANMGHPDWSWERVEPFFKKVENCVGHPKAQHLGHKGPVHIRNHRPQFELHNHIDKSAAAVGLPIEEDVNNPAGPAAGYYYLDYTLDKNGHRHSAYSAYLPKEVAISRRASLSVCTRAIASRLELDAENGIVTGVYFRSTLSKSPRDFFAKARKEVIICSGATCSPQLLMLSGIGPAEHLHSLNIPVVKDLRGVGANLSDHHGIPIMLKMPLADSYHRMESDYLWAVWQVLRFAWNGDGWLKSGTTSSTIFLNTSRIDPSSSTLTPGPGDLEFDSSRAENVPDLEIMVIPAGTIVGKHPGVPLFTLYTCLIQPKSLGRVELASTDPTVSPKIHYQMLESPHDIAAARSAVRFSLNIAENFMTTSGYRHHVELFFAPNAESQRNWQDLGDDEIDDFVRASIQSVVHLGCTCRMAKEADGGVVDDALKVYGFENLRIADASVFPKIPACHTMAPTYMVAERCAQFVKDTWKTQG
ncbi:choline dehydrogenase [Seiridium cupressi]